MTKKTLFNEQADLKKNLIEFLETRHIIIIKITNLVDRLNIRVGEPEVRIHSLNWKEELRICSDAKWKYKRDEVNRRGEKSKNV